jgi:hypothetical protein
MRSFRSRIPVAPAPGDPLPRWGPSTLAAILLSFFLAVPGIAQEPTAATPLTGTVRSAPDGGGVSGAEVRIPGLGLQAFSDATGRFRFPSLPPGTHRVEVERIGYRPASVEVTLDADPARNAPVEIHLEPDPLLLSELVVSTSGELRRRAETPASVGSIQGEAIREVNPNPGVRPPRRRGADPRPGPPPGGWRWSASGPRWRSPWMRRFERGDPIPSSPPFPAGGWWRRGPRAGVASSPSASPACAREADREAEPRWVAPCAAPAPPGMRGGWRHALPGRPSCPR